MIEKINTIFESINKDRVIQNDKNQSFDEALWKNFGEHRLQGLMIPEQYGGKGYNIAESMNALEALGYACTDNGMSFALGAHQIYVMVIQ